MADNGAALEAASQAPLITSLAIIFVVLSTTSLILRLYTRKKILQMVGPDDSTITIAQILAIAVSVLTVLQAIWGLGRHTQFVIAEDATRQLKCLYANTLIYNAAQTLTKISFLILYRRLFPSRKTQVVCLWLLLFIVAWGIVQEFIVGFSCTPLSSIVPKMQGRCIYTLPVWYLTSCMNIVTDFMIFLVPVFPVIKLQLRVRQKVLLLCLFCLGFFTCAISLVRLSVLHRGVNTTDPFWDNAPAAYWSVVELNCGILCACLPTLRPLIQKLVPHLLSTHGHSTEIESSNQLSTFGDKSSRANPEDGIYVRREVEMHSTTELNASQGSNRPSYEDAASQKTTVTVPSSQGFS